MSKRSAGPAAALALVAAGWPAPGSAAVPALGTREGELLCAGLMSVVASGAALSTGGDVVTFAKAHGVFLGRLSVVAPNARYRFEEVMVDLDKLTPAEQDELSRTCFAKLDEIGAIDLHSSAPQMPKPTLKAPAPFR